jgi:thiol-disulfide isomerase/thioredoxin
MNSVLVLGLAAIIALTGCCAAQTTDTAIHDFLKANGLEGKCAFIEFGVIGCQRSEQGLNNMIALCRDRKIPDLSFLRVEAAADTATFDAYYEKKAPGFPIVRDQKTTIAKDFRATIYPTFVIVDKYGNVRYRGKYPGEKLAPWVASLSSEASDPGPNPPMLGAAVLDIPKLLAKTTLPDLKGKKTTLAKCAGKSGLLIMFVNTTCPYSAIAIDEFPKVAETLAKRKIGCVMVNVADPAARVKQFYAKKQTSLLLWDTTQDTALAWDVQAVPTTVFITNGAVKYRGGGEWGSLAKGIEGALSLAEGTILFPTKGTEYG